MKDKLEDLPTPRPAADKTAAPPQKTPYSSPVLQVYGSVAELTQSTSQGTRADGFRGRTKI